MKIKAYTQEIKAQMINFYNSLSEKDRRRYAAIEAIKLGSNGDTYIRSILHCDDRKFVIDEMKGLNEAFLNVLQNHTAGSPMDETIKWTNLSRHDIVEKLKEQGLIVRTTVIDQLLRKHDFSPRQAFKIEAGKKNISQRDEQFKNIERLKQEYTDKDNPVLSMEINEFALVSITGSN